MHFVMMDAPAPFAALLTLHTISSLKIAFEDSDLPVCVDIVDWSQAASEFKAMIIRQGMVEMQH